MMPEYWRYVDNTKIQHNFKTSVTVTTKCLKSYVWWPLYISQRLGECSPVTLDFTGLVRISKAADVTKLWDRPYSVFLRYIIKWVWLGGLTPHLPRTSSSYSCATADKILTDTAHCTAPLRHGSHIIPWLHHLDVICLIPSTLSLYNTWINQHHCSSCTPPSNLNPSSLITQLNRSQWQPFSKLWTWLHFITSKPSRPYTLKQFLETNHWRDKTKTNWT